ncbi:histidine-type phosphatase [Novosphingobium terrae]|uniref:histidine-type phosphatase n=1 Tax=Novosphingobium terrae TaxID=2726189 RepID=UPI00197E34DB|nr:histidine-type phosphatase [Novosphingobium terrae]
MGRVLTSSMVALAALMALPVATGSALAAESAPGWTLDRVVVVMRHGVRPPTKADPLPQAMAPAPWPTWDVNWGELSHHGEKAVALLGTFDRASYAPLLGTGCPTIHAVADTDQRTVRTAEVYVATLLPGCTVSVEHKGQSESDPLFQPFESGSTLLSPEQTLAAAKGVLPRGGALALDRDLAPQWAMIDRILQCHAAACIAAKPTALSAGEGKVKLAGALGLGGSFSETLALEYADGKPMSEVGWGRASRAQITSLLMLHAQEFAVTARPAAIARAGSARLLGDVATALASPQAPAFSLFVGHDGNLALIGGALGLHWHAAQFAPDDPPPGGALIFERWHNAAGRYRLTVRFRAQSLDEMRNLTPSGPKSVQTLPFAACSETNDCDAEGLRKALSPQ